MKSLIYSRVSTKEQSTDRQVQELKALKQFEAVAIFREKISGFSKSAKERPVLQRAITYAESEKINCILVHEISRLGRNTLDVLNLLEELKKKKIQVYIRNLGITVNTNNPQDEIFSKLIITLMADLARLESEQMSCRIKSGIRARKAKGLSTGRKVDSKESPEKFLAKHKDIQKYISRGYSSREIQRICKCSPNTIQKVKKLSLFE